MSYYLVKDFVHGLDVRRMDETTEPGALIEAKNCVITRGGEIEKRKAFTHVLSVPNYSYGLYAHDAIGGEFHVWGSRVHIPQPGQKFIYHRIRHHWRPRWNPEVESRPAPVPTTRELVKIRAVRYFIKKFFVVAEFDNGDVQSFYGDTIPPEGATIPDDFILEGALVSDDEYVVNDDDPESPSVEPDPYPVGQGRPNAQVLIIRNGEGAAEITSIPVFPQISITGINFVGTENVVETMYAFRSDTASGVPAIPIAEADTANVIVGKIADAINAYVPPAGEENFHAKADNITLHISFADVGEKYNTYWGAIVVSENILLITPRPIVFSGGIAQTEENQPEPTAVLEGAYSPGTDAFVTSKVFQPGRYALQHKDKMFAVGGKTGLLHISATRGPAFWDPSHTGAGFLDFSTSGGRNESTLISLGVFQNTLAIFAGKAIYIWDMKESLDASSERSILHNTGTFAPRSVVEFGNTDIFYLDQTGIRSLQSRELTGEGFSSDIGNPIDDLVIEQVRKLGFFIEIVDGVIEPNDGRYTLAMGNKLFVFSFFAKTKIAAWTEWEVPFIIEELVTDSGHMYARDRTKIYAYGRFPGVADEYDSTKVEAQLPFLSAGKPATAKNLMGFDAAVQGEWLVEMAVDPTQRELLEPIGVIASTTYRHQRIGIVGYSTHGSFKLTHEAPGPAKIGQVVFHYDDGEEPG